MHINVYFVIYHKINTHLFLWVNLALPQVGFWSHFSRFGRPHVSQMKYGVIRAAVTQAMGERSFLIGYYPCATGDLNLLPFHSRDVTLVEGDRLVLLRRPLLPQEEDENSDESQKNEVEVGEIGTEIEGSE